MPDKLPNTNYIAKRVDKGVKTDAGKRFDKNLSATMGRYDVTEAEKIIQEIDKNLENTQGSIKKKIWDLSKMESLVHSDPKLEAIYQDMEREAEENQRYGYHWNEAVLNIMFNDYVLNSPKYLQKYKMAIPTQKKRRDKSGIKDLQRQGAQQMQKKGVDVSKERKTKKPEGVPEGEIHNNSLAGVIEEQYKLMENWAGDMSDEPNRQPVDQANQNDHLKHRINRKYDTMDNMNEHHLFTKEDKIDFILHHTYDDATDSAKYSIEQLNSMPDEQIDDIYRSIERDKLGIEEGGMNEHHLETREEKEKFIYKHKPSLVMGQIKSLSDEAIDQLYHDLEVELGMVEPDEPVVEPTPEEDPMNVANPQEGPLDESAVNENGDMIAAKQEKDEEEDINETTATISQGGGSGSGAFETKAGLSADYGKKKKKKKGIHTSFWPGGKVVGKKNGIKESNYLTNPLLFESIYEELDEEKMKGENPCWKNYKMLGHKEENGKKVPNCVPEGMNSPNDDSRVPISENVPAGGDPTKEEMIEFLQSQYGSEYDEFDAEEAIYWFTYEYHGGQNSNMYSALSTSDYRPSPLSTNGSNLTGTSKLMYRDLVDEYEGGNQFTEESMALGKGEGPSIIDTMKDVPAGGMGSMGGSSMGGGMFEGKEKINEVEKLKKLADFSEKYNLTPTGNAGKFKIDDLTPVITNPIDKDDLYDLGLYFANRIIRSQTGLDWNDLPDINSLWDYVEGHRNMKDFIQSIKDAVNERVSDVDSGFAFEGINEDVSRRTKCKSDEEPVKGKRINEPGGCKKKDTVKPEEKKKNPHNIKSRQERIKRQEKEMKNKEKEQISDIEKSKKEMAEQKEMFEAVLKEDKKPASLVNVERLGKENEKNFKKDTNIADAPDELSAMEQMEEVPENPYELGEKIEAQKIKDNKMQSFENEGDSTNDDNKHIPKRNLTSDEDEEINMMRNGQHSIVYDNEPSDRFKERMERDMGEEISELRKKQMEFKGDMKRYNKENQPITKSKLDDNEMNKYKQGYIKQTGIGESVVTGKFRNDFGKNEYVNFKLNEVEEIDKIDESYTLLNMDGLGNRYDKNVELNENANKVIEQSNFYIKEGKIYINIEKSVLNESENKKEKIINEQFKKFKKLSNYSPNNFIDTKHARKILK